MLGMGVHDRPECSDTFPGRRDDVSEGGYLESGAGGRRGGQRGAPGYYSNNSYVTVVLQTPGNTTIESLYTSLSRESLSSESLYTSHPILILAELHKR